MAADGKYERKHSIRVQILNFEWEQRAAQDAYIEIDTVMEAYWDENGK